MKSNPAASFLDTFNLLVKSGVSEEEAFKHCKEQFNNATQDDQLTWKKSRLLESAKVEITNLLLRPRKNEVALADIPLKDSIFHNFKIADLPTIVASAISVPYGTLGIDDSPQWGKSDSSWFIFQHKAEDFIRAKISHCTLRKHSNAIDRLQLAIGCFKWASLCGVRDIPNFQAAFTTALLLDKDATAEINGETIDIRPLETKAPLGEAMLTQIWEMLKDVRSDTSHLRGMEADLQILARKKQKDHATHVKAGKKFGFKLKKRDDDPKRDNAIKYAESLIRNGMSERSAAAIAAKKHNMNPDSLRRAIQRRHKRSKK